MTGVKALIGHRPAAEGCARHARHGGDGGTRVAFIPLTAAKDMMTNSKC